MKQLSRAVACRRFRSYLSEIVAHEAPPEVVAEADEHRTVCSECTSEYQLAVRVELGLGILPELDPGMEPSADLSAMFERSFERAEALAFDPTQPVELMLGCAEFKDMLDDFVSEELPVYTMLDGVEHASACRPCGDELTDLQTLQDTFRSLGELEPPAGIYASLVARIEAEESAAAAIEGESVKVKQTAGARVKLLPVLG